MNPKSLLIVVIVAAVAVGAAILLRQRTSPVRGLEATKLLNEFPLNEVTTLVIKSPSSEVTLEKKGDEWTVRERSGYPADFSLVKSAIQGLWELRAVQEVKAGAAQLGRLNLLEPSGNATNSGTIVDLLDKNNNRIAALLIGKESFLDRSNGPGEMNSPNGRFVMGILPTTSPMLVPFTFDTLSDKPTSWIDKDFIQLDNIRSISVSGPKKNWTLFRDTENAPWQLKDLSANEKIDVSKAPSAGLSLSPVVLDVLPTSQGPSEQKAIITSFDGFTYELDFGKSTPEGVPVSVKVSLETPRTRTPVEGEKPEDAERLQKEFASKLEKLNAKLAHEKTMEGKVFLVSPANLGPLLKDRSEFLTSPNEATTPPLSANPAAAPKSPPN